MLDSFPKTSTFVKNLLPFVSMLVITLMPFRGNRNSESVSQNYFAAGSSFYSTFAPENIDGFYVLKVYKKHRKRDKIKMVTDLTNRQAKLFADSVCKSLKVPNGLVLEIGQNESQWNFIRQKRGGRGKGDLQVIDNTFAHWYNLLHLKGGHTRSNYLIVSIHYLKHCYQEHGSWKKARFVYARGHWRDESTWTPMERAFMNKINWTNYDR
jgi:hypothetical protein